MTQRLLLILVGLWLITCSSLTAQVGFSLPVLNNVNAGTNVIMPVKVTNFDSIVGAQFVIQWDTQVLSFIAAFAYNLPNMTTDDFGLGETQNGILRFAWESSSVSNGTTVPDSTNIFFLKFTVTGQVNQGSALTFTEIPPTVFEVIQVGQPPLNMGNCALTNGFVAVGYTVGVTEMGDQNSLPVAIFPNPFFNSTTAFIDLDTGSDVQLTLTDATGQLVWEKRLFLPPGQNGMEIASDQLQENGIYFLILRTATRSCIRSLVKL